MELIKLFISPLLNVCCVFGDQGGTHFLFLLESKPPTVEEKEYVLFFVYLLFLFHLFTSLALLFFIRGCLLFPIVILFAGSSFYFYFSRRFFYERFSLLFLLHIRFFNLVAALLKYFLEHPLKIMLMPFWIFSMRTFSNFSTVSSLKCFFQLSLSRIFFKAPSLDYYRCAHSQILLQCLFSNIVAALSL